VHRDSRLAHRTRIPLAFRSNRRGRCAFARFKVVARGPEIHPSISEVSSMNSDRPIQVLSPPAATGVSRWRATSAFTRVFDALWRAASASTSSWAARFTPEHFNRALFAAGLLVLVALAALAAAKAWPGVFAAFDQRILVTLAAVFAGALVAGLAGFAFSAMRSGARRRARVATTT
jgi:hypothetical protein